MARQRPTSQVAENISDLLTCAICMDPYDENDHQAKLLPCHHSFCKQCLLHLSQNQTFLDCPTCRQRTQLPGNGGILNLQANFYVSQMKELLGDSSRIKVKGCRKHSGQGFTHFCKTCEIAVCPDCAATDHREAAGHMTQDMETAVQEQGRLLQMEMDESQQTILTNSVHVKNLQSEVENLYSCKDRAAQDIEKMFDAYIEAINHRRQQLQNHLKDIYKYKKETLTNRIEDLRKQSTSLSGLFEQCEEAINNGNISDILAYKAKMTTKNSELRSDQANFSPGSNYIKFDPEENIGRFSEYVQDLGSIHIQEALPSIVRVTNQRGVASLLMNLSVSVKSCAGDGLPDYPVEMEIIDPQEDEIPAKIQHHEDGKYDVTFRPQVAGVHRLKVTFLGRPIPGSETAVNVLTNNPVLRIGQKGMRPGEMEYPRAVAVDKSNNIYVVDTGNCRIQKLDSSGRFLYHFPISAESDSYSSCGISVSSDHGVIICPEVAVQAADLSQAHSILVYTMDGQLKHRRNYPGMLRRALSVAVNSMGQVIIADFELNSIFIFDHHGRLVGKFGESGSGPSQFNHPTFVCVGENDCIIVSDGDNHRIQVFDRTGKYIYEFGERGSKKGQFFMPFGITTDKHGNIIVVDGGNKRIQVFKYGGIFVSEIDSGGDKMNAPRGVAVTTDGHVVVADRDNHCVKKFKYMHCATIV